MSTIDHSGDDEDDREENENGENDLGGCGCKELLELL